jgi:acetyl-CoA C-acetyltransferase
MNAPRFRFAPSPTGFFHVGGARTAFGKFGGGFKDVAVSDLAVPAVQEALKRADLAPDQVDHLVLGNTVHTTADAPFGSRVVTLNAGLPERAASLGVITLGARGWIGRTA